MSIYLKMGINIRYYTEPYFPRLNLRELPNALYPILPPKELPFYDRITVTLKWKEIMYFTTQGL